MKRATAAAMNSTAPIVANPATQATLFSSNFFWGKKKNKRDGESEICKPPLK